MEQILEYRLGYNEVISHQQQLLTAIQAGDLKEVDRLVNLGKLNAREGVQPLLGADPSRSNNRVIDVAIRSGQVEIAKFLLRDPRVDPTKRNNLVFRLAAMYGHLEIVQQLAADPRVDPTAKDNAAIRSALRENHTNVVKFLTGIPRVLLGAIDYYIENIDIGSIIKIGIIEDFAMKNVDDICYFAVTVGSLSLVRYLIAQGRDPAIHNNTYIRIAARHGNTDMVQLLLADPRVDPAAENDDAMAGAIINGHVEVVRLLLADSRIDPSGKNNTFLSDAVKNKQADMIRLLVQDSRIDPMVLNNYGFGPVVMRGDINTVRVLAEFPSVLLPMIDYYLQNNELHTLNLLARMTGAYPRSETDPVIAYEDLLVWGAAVGSLRLVIYLVKKGIDPTFADNSAIVAAQQHGHGEIVKYLLTLPNVHLRN